MGSMGKRPVIRAPQRCDDFQEARQCRGSLAGVSCANRRLRVRDFASVWTRYRMSFFETPAERRCAEALRCSARVSPRADPLEEITHERHERTITGFSSAASMWARPLQVDAQTQELRPCGYPNPGCHNHDHGGEVHPSRIQQRGLRSSRIPGANRSPGEEWMLLEIGVTRCAMECRTSR